MANSDESAISQRKSQHLEVAASGDADFHRRTLLADVHLVHQSLPEMAVDEVNLEVSLAGLSLRAPIVVSGMTGGTKQAGLINRDLARAAEALGLGFGVGSQRAMVDHPDLESSFTVRDAAPNVVLLGNIGAVQAKAYGPDRVAELARRIGANAMCVHLNPAQELIQDHGDRDFRGLLSTIDKLVNRLEIPIVVKETGCGFSLQVAEALVGIGVRTVDVSGAGGTSWVAVEAIRAAKGGARKALGEELWDWGLPTAVSVAMCASRGLDVIATGGLRSGHDIARAMALGARCGGLAAPVLRAHRSGGYDAAFAFLERLVTSLTSVGLLCGVRSIADLPKVPRHIGGELRGWLDDFGLR